MIHAPCIDCGRPMRTHGTLTADHPGTVQHYGRGLCTTCSARAAPSFVWDERPWLDQALCAQTGPDDAVWFPTKGGSNRAAKALCRRCPVRVECLEDALATEGSPAYGVRGGLNERERRKLKGKTA